MNMTLKRMTPAEAINIFEELADQVSVKWKEQYLIRSAISSLKEEFSENIDNVQQIED